MSAIVFVGIHWLIYAYILFKMLFIITAAINYFLLLQRWHFVLFFVLETSTSVCYYGGLFNHRVLWTASQATYHMAVHLVEQSNHEQSNIPSIPVYRNMCCLSCIVYTKAVVHRFPSLQPLACIYYRQWQQFRISRNICDITSQTEDTDQSRFAPLMFLEVKLKHVLS